MSTNIRRDRIFVSPESFADFNVFSDTISALLIQTGRVIPISAAYALPQTKFFDPNPKDATKSSSNDMPKMANVSCSATDANNVKPAAKQAGKTAAKQASIGSFFKSKPAPKSTAPIASLVGTNVTTTRLPATKPDDKPSKSRSDTKEESGKGERKGVVDAGAFWRYVGSERVEMGGGKVVVKNLPEPAKAVYDPKLADRLVGSVQLNKSSHRLMAAWFSNFTHNYTHGKPNLRPLLAVVGSPGAGKTWLIDWLATAHHVKVQPIDPLDFKQTIKLNTKKKKPQKKSRKISTTNKTNTDADADADANTDAMEEIRSVEDDEKEEEARRYDRLVNEAGSDGETLRQLVMPNALGVPKLIHIQDIHLCKPQFLRYLFALSKMISKIPRCNAIVIEMTADEAYGQMQNWGTNALEEMALGTFLKKNMWCQFVKLFTASDLDIRQYALNYRAKNGFPRLFSPREDAEFITKIVGESRADIRQVEINLEWHHLPDILKHTPKLLDKSKVPRPLSPPRIHPVAAVAAAVKPSSPAMDHRRRLYSDLDVGFMLLRREMMGCLLAEEVVGQLRMYPLLQVSEFLRSWIFTNSGYQTESAKKADDDPVSLVACTSESLVQLMIRGLEMDAERKARAMGSFSQFRHVKQLPPEIVLALFGHVRRLAVQTAFFCEFILNNFSKITPPTVSPKVASVAEPPPASNDKVIKNEGPKKRALGVITTDSAGFVEVDKLAPRKKKKPADDKKKKKASTNSSNLPQTITKGNAGYAALLAGIAGMSMALSEHDANPYMPDGESIWIMSCQRLALDVLSSLHDDDLLTPDWATIAQWIHPKRFDLVSASRKKSTAISILADKEP